MGLTGKEIIQTRVWIEPKATKPPNLNYKNTYPITVLEAVKEDMDDNAKNLKYILDAIHQDISNKQPIFSAKPAEYLMTYAGVAGKVGSIITTRDIPWDPSKQRHDRIPTEKAVGDLLLKLGLVDKNGNIDPNGGTRVDWKNIIGRPNVYNELGKHDDGFMTQLAVTEAITTVDKKVDELSSDITGKFNTVSDKLNSHLSNTNNPHHVTIDQIGAISKEAFQFHIDNFENPHKVTKLQIGLDNVDNTSDANKPISKATQDALAIINKLIEDLNGEIENFVIDVKYDQPSGILTVILKNGSKLTLSIPINGLIDEIKYDKDSKQLLAVELGGHINKIDISELFVRYLGGSTSQITVKIDDTTEMGTHIINASINSNSISDNEIQDNSVITRIIKDQSVTTDKIKDLSITTIKLSDNSVTKEKIAELSVTTKAIADRAINGRTLFSSNVDNRLLGVLAGSSDPIWLQANGDMIADKAIRSTHLSSKSVITDKLDDKSVTTSKLDDGSITTEKLADLGVTDDKIANETITGNKLISDIVIPGIPRSTSRPSETANNNQLVDSFWVNNKLYKAKMRNDNIMDRAIDGRTLFSSGSSNKVLAVLAANSNPIWTSITNAMMADNSISTSNIIDLNVTGSKIADDAIVSRHINTLSVLTDHISESAVTSTKLWKSDVADRILAVVNKDSHPVYTMLTRGMFPDGIIGLHQLEDRSVSMSKLDTSRKNNRLLAVVTNNTDPVWMQATSEMLGDRSVTGRVLFSSNVKNRILAVTETGTDPAWLQVTGDMIKDGTITKRNLGPAIISGDNIQDKTIKSNNIADHTIETINIAPKAITGTELFTSGYPNRVLALSNAPYSTPDWLQVATDMIADKAVTKEKIFQSEHPYRVLATTQGGVPPEYIKITSDFIVDDTIIPQKLVHNFVLYGTPESTQHPPADADNRQIPDTYWVRRTVANMIKDFNPRILFDTVSAEMIQNNSIDGTKLFSTSKGARVLGVTRANADPEYILIEENLIVDGAVTKSKLAKDITLMGSPTVEIRPFHDASDEKGGGNLIPDCQWVLDAIAFNKNGTVKFDPEYFINTPYGLSLNLVNILTSRTEIDKLFTNPSGGTGTGSGGSSGGTGTGGGASLVNDSIVTDYIVNRAVTGDKLFTSTVPNRVLGVLSPNTSPEYLQIVNDMMSDRSINGRTLFTSATANKILGITTPGSDPAWMLINYDMMDKNSIGTINLRDSSVTNFKVADNAIDGRTLFSSSTPGRILGVLDADSDPSWMQITSDMIGAAVVNKSHIQNDSISTPKICDHAVTQVKLEEGPIIDTIRIIDKSVTSQKIAHQAVENVNIKDNTIEGNKLAESIQLPGHPVVAPDSGTSYQTRQLRNTIISPDAPSGGEDGDIWLRYI